MSEQAKIYIGTSGWSYPKGEGTWNGYFYPQGTKNELEYYSQFFNTVEVNSSFYHPPSSGYVLNWVKRTPSGFLFTVKLWQKFTHPKMYQAATGQEAVVLQQDVDLFKQGIEPLVRYQKLGAILAQFPPSFRNDEQSREFLAAVMKAFSEYRLAVELRHRSWSDDKNIATLLRAYNVAWVQIDEPKFRDSIAVTVPVTSDMAYFRFHGRNAETWWKGDTETRYKYLYSPEEIAELAGRIEAAAIETKLLFTMFNNHWQGDAPHNAVDTLRQLKLPLKEDLL